MEPGKLRKSIEILVDNVDRLSEDIFVDRIGEFSRIDGETTLSELRRLLVRPDASKLQQYRILQAVGISRLTAAIPLVEEFLAVERPVQIFRQAVRTLGHLNTLGAYRALLRLRQAKENAGLPEAVDAELAELLARNPLLFHFDQLIRSRPESTTADSAAEFLASRLPDEALTEVLPITASGATGARLAALFIFARRSCPNALSFLSALLLKEGGDLKGDLFKATVEALLFQARNSNPAVQPVDQLKNLLPRLSEPERTWLEIQMARLEPARFLPPLLSRYTGWGAEQRLNLLRALPDSAELTSRFLQSLIQTEDQPAALELVVRKLLLLGESTLLFQAVEEAGKTRRKMLLEMIFANSSTGLVDHLGRFLRPDEDDDIISLVLTFAWQRLLPVPVERLASIFQAGVSHSVRKLVVRHLDHLKPGDCQRFLSLVLSEKAIVAPLIPDILPALQPKFEDAQGETQHRDQLLSQILVLMEEAPAGQVGPFIRFFEKFRPRNGQERNLLADELKLVQMALLRHGDESRLLPRIHHLLKKLG